MSIMLLGKMIGMGADGSPGGTAACRRIQASLKPRLLPRLSIWIAFVPAGNNRGKALVPHRLKSVVTNGQGREFSLAGFMRVRMCADALAPLRAMRRSSLRDDAVGPLDQGNKNCGTSDILLPPGLI